MTMRWRLYRFASECWRGGREGRKWLPDGGLLAGLLLVAVVAAAGSLQSIVAPGPGEQYLFSAEDTSVRRPVAVPEHALQLLAKEPGVLATLKAERIPEARPPQAWFLASEVHLGGPREPDLVVIGVGPLRGANVGEFWVFERTEAGYRIVLSTSAMQLEILGSKSNGYRNIRGTRLIGATKISSVVFRFRGGKYQADKPKIEPIG